MKKPTPNTVRIEPTQTEIDLGKHLSGRIYTILADFADTARVAEIEQRRAVAIMISMLLEAAFSGMLNLRLSAEHMQDLINETLKAVCEKELRK